MNLALRNSKFCKWSHLKVKSSFPILFTALSSKMYPNRVRWNDVPLTAQSMKDLRSDMQLQYRGSSNTVLEHESQEHYDRIRRAGGDSNFVEMCNDAYMQDVEFDLMVTPSPLLQESQRDANNARLSGTLPSDLPYRDVAASRPLR
ncbi:unnamed protein product [Somion occarium]|uniref:Uncharacterized protein n=1 Tax=Somion occarium TaxID=3059160 RepID=A0ABP1CW19_9APHY